MKRIIAALAICASPALAADPAPIDFTQVLIGVTGEPIKVDPAKPDVLTLGEATAVALDGTLDEDRNLDPKKKWDRDDLARFVYKNKAAVLSPDDAALIKERLGKMWPSGVVGAAWPFLDPTLKRRAP
jgi:hypothetical protein